ncbi:hypothetical protein PSHT_05309 [Puccinia striiformis]|uniref:Uncharacterized protein n=1 Tax=Puccinia striiformis TaxID=27350 RepID=A0A2S4WAS9_9BASI|nr:hypothetical protein PSHT_05309 [Puccinia striiformis]
MFDFITSDTKHRGDLVTLGFENLISKNSRGTNSESDSDDESSSDSEEDEPRSRNIMQITKADLWPMLGDSFRKSCDLVLHLKLSSETPEGQIDIAFTKRDLSRLASRICGDLHETVDSLKESDFDNSDIVIANINRTLRDFVLPTRERYFSILDPSSRQKDPRFRINESAIVVMKLARLFFRQLSRRELIIEKELSLLGSLSEKLKNLHDLPLTAIGQLEALSHILGRFDIPTTSVSHLPPPEIVTQSTRYVESTKGSFRRALIAVDTFVTWLPTNGGSLDQRYFKTWFRDWDTLFTLAANHLLEAIDSFIGDFNDVNMLDKQHQADLVILGFENLIGRYDQHTSQRAASQTSQSLNGIEYNLLPKLVTYFREFCVLINQTKFSSSGTTNEHTDINSSKTSVIGLRDQICEEIEEIENDFLGSDYDTSDLIIHDLPRLVVSGLEELFEILRKPFLITWHVLHLTTQDSPDEPFGIVETLKTRFRRALIALPLFICEIPDYDRFVNLKYFESWFRTWDTLFTISINNLLDVIDSVLPFD